MDLSNSPIHLIVEVFRFSKAAEMVRIRVLNWSSTDSLARSNAGTSTSIVSLPSFAILRSSPVVVTPKPVAIAFANAGVCSITELNSSPRRIPLPRACPNCVNAASAAPALAPDTATALDTVSVKLAPCLTNL